MHSLDILTVDTNNGPKVVSVLVWADCVGRTSHSCQTGYIVDMESEQVVAPASFYGAYFKAQPQTGLIKLGQKLPGVRKACQLCEKAHVKRLESTPWMCSVGWDCMLTDDNSEGMVFFEGNFASYRLSRRVFLSFATLRAFILEFWY